MKQIHSKYYVILILFLASHLCAYSQVITTFPYYENFETGSPFWTTSNVGALNSNWELGNPTYGLTNSTHSGTNCWDVNLDSAYANSANCILETPEFDFTGINNATLSFWQNRFTELGWDGFHLEYSLDQGVSWTYLGFFSDPLGVNWYSNSLINSTGNAAWDDNSNGWIQSSYNLSAFNNVASIKFRFVFTSDGALVKDGVSIDDFRITLPLAVDATLASINSTINRLPYGVTSGPLSVTVKNSGSTTLSNYSISYKVNGGSLNTTNFSNPILPNDTLQLTVPGFIVPLGGFNLCISVNKVGDQDHNNDTICRNGIGITSYTIPFTDSFDSINKGWTVYNPTDTISKWQLGMPNYGATNSTHSGNNCWDVNLTTAYGINANTELWSPIFNFTGTYNAVLSFWRNQNSEANWDGVRIDYSLNGASTWNVLGTLGDTLASNWYTKATINSSTLPAWDGVTNFWQKSTYHLSILDNQPNVILRYVFSSDASVVADGVSIDDFQITPALAKDLSLDSITTELFNLRAGATLNPFVIKVRNESYQPVSNFNVGYRINNGIPIISNYPGTLNPNAVAYISMAGFTVPAGNYSICSFVNLSGDLNILNDSLCQTQVGQVAITPTVFNDFESGEQGWITQTLGLPNTNWEYGTPFYGSTSSTHSGTKAWDVNLLTPYFTGAKTYLYSPVYDFSSAVNPWLIFWQNRNTIGNDGFYVEYFDDNIGFWQQVPNVLNVSAYNWYNSTVYDLTGKSGWTGASTGWIKSGISLDSLNITGSVQFRFAFISATFNSSGDGVTIDDVTLKVDYQRDAEITSIVSPGTQAAAGGNTDVIVTLRNNGVLTLNSLNIKYTNNNGSPVSYIWTGNLLHDSSAVVNLPQEVPSPGSNNLVVYVDWASDEYHDNDTLRLTYTGISVIAPPFSDNMENGNNYWFVTPSGFGSTTWELGSPNYGTTNSCHSGANCWDINLTTPYGILANTALYSPIFNYSNATSSTLDFWMNYNSEFNQDGLRLEYSTNGNVWNVLGIVNDPNATNWYNGIIIPQNKPGWSGNSGTWEHCIYNTSAFNGLSFIRYRFVFTSDLSLVAPGFSIDDFNVDETVGINDLTEGIQFSISPNPVNDQLNIHFKNLANKKYSYQIFDISGRQIQSQNETNNINSSNLNIPVNNLAQGIYQLVISVDGFRKTVSFCKE